MGFIVIRATSVGVGALRATSVGIGALRATSTGSDNDKTANKKMCHFSGRAELYLFFRLVNFFVCQSQTRISDCC